MSKVLSKRIRVVVQYLLISFICFGSLFFKITHPIISIEDKWFATVLLLLFYVIVGKTAGCSFSKSINELFNISCTVITVFCFGLAIYGILQRIGIISLNFHLGITGTFDNPAGYASSLCAGFPAFLYFYSQCRAKWIAYISALSGLLVAIAIVLSESRSGILSIVAMLVVWFLLKIKVSKRLLISFLIGFTLLASTLYFYKKDSADGRLLIWKCSWEMIRDKPLLGHGTGGFRANYMDYQANYFKQNPESPYGMLADNTNRPFNEYILLLTNYGVVGFLFFGIFIFFLWKSYRYNPCPESKVAFTCLTGVAVFSCFSYPLSYPFVWIMMIFSIYTLIIHGGYFVRLSRKVQKAICLIIICMSFTAFVWVTEQMLNQIVWAKTAKKSYIRQSDVTVAQYDKLLPKLKNNHLFLYNYAAELNHGGYYSHSQQIAETCHKIWADYDLQLLMGYNCVKMQQYEEAEKYFEQAAYMCPVRFVPLRELMNIYLLKGEQEKVVKMAEQILNKPMKIPSVTIEQIKEEARTFITNKC